MDQLGDQMSASDFGKGQFHERPDRDHPPEPDGVLKRRSLLATGLILLATCVVLLLVWQTASSLLIVFAGVLFAAFLDSAARALGHILPLNRALRLSLVLLLLCGLLGVGFVWGTGKLPEQTRNLMKVMDAQVDVGQGHHGKNYNDNNDLSKWFDSGFLGTIIATH
jgi:predicted PurR-regulated permease PerM